MTHEQLSCYLSGKEDTTVGLYEDIQDFDTTIRNNLERVETLGAPRDRLVALAAARSDHYYGFGRFMRDEKGGAAVEYALIFSAFILTISVVLADVANQASRVIQ